MNIKKRLKYRNNLKRIRAQEKALPNDDYWFVSSVHPAHLTALQLGIFPTQQERMLSIEDAFFDLDWVYAESEDFGGEGF